MDRTTPPPLPPTWPLLPSCSPTPRRWRPRPPPRPWRTGNRNLAVGTLLQIEQTVPDARAIMDATLALHRVGPAALRGFPLSLSPPFKPFKAIS